jgi:hypothetical protein
VQAQARAEPLLQVLNVGGHGTGGHPELTARGGESTGLNNLNESGDIDDAVHLFGYSEQAAPAVGIKTLFNLALNGVGEFSAGTLEVPCDFVFGLPQSRCDEHIKHTSQQAGSRSLFCSSRRRGWDNVSMMEEIF